MHHYSPGLPPPARGLQFTLEEVAERRHRSLLLASVSTSEAATRAAAGWGGARLPALPPPLRKAISRLAKPRPGHAGDLAKQRRGGSQQGPDLARAGQDLHRAVAVVAGVLIAGVAQAARRVAAARHGPHGQQRHHEFHDSFRLPWQRAPGGGANRSSQALARTLAARGEEYQRNLDVRAAVQCYEEVNRLAPGDIGYLALLAKQWSDLTFYHDVTTDRERQLVNLKALEYADKAVTEHPSNVLGHVAQCVSKGRLALFTDNRTKVRLAKEAQEAARVALACDPSSDVAHHLMGRWHYEMAQINPLLRTLVRLMYGTALSPGTHAEALASFQRAQQLNPGRLIHRVEAGKVLLALGRKEEAARHFEEALSMDVEDLNAWHTRMDAERLLCQIHKQPYSQPSMVPPHARAGDGPAPTPASLSTAALIAGSEGGMPQRAPRA